MRINLSLGKTTSSAKAEPLGSRLFCLNKKAVDFATQRARVFALKPFLFYNK